MKIAFIGCGRITNSHITSIRRLKLGFDVEIAGFYSPDTDSLNEIVARWGGRAFDSIQELIDFGPDTVYITSPTPFHAEQACLVARAGIPFYLEKPAAQNHEEFALLKSTVESSGVIHSLGVQWRYRPETRRLKDLLSSNPATMVAGQWYWFTPPVAWLRRRDQGGGQVFDQLIHLLDLANYVVGPADRVFARFGESPNRRYPDFSNWDVYALSLGYTKGCIGSFTSTYRLNVPLDDQVHIDFIAGDLLIRYTPDSLTVWREGEIVSYPETQERGLDMIGRDHIERAFLEAVSCGKKEGLVSTLDDVENTMEIIFAATESAESGREIVLG